MYNSNAKANEAINAVIVEAKQSDRSYVPGPVTIRRDARGNVTVSYRVVQFIPVDKDE